MDLALSSKVYNQFFYRNSTYCAQPMMSLRCWLMNTLVQRCHRWEQDTMPGGGLWDVPRPAQGGLGSGGPTEEPDSCFVPSSLQKCSHVSVDPPVATPRAPRPQTGLKLWQSLTQPSRQSPDLGTSWWLFQLKAGPTWPSVSPKAVGGNSSNHCVSSDTEEEPNSALAHERVHGKACLVFGDSLTLKHFQPSGFPELASVAGLLPN